MSAAKPKQVPPYLKPSLIGRACGLSRREAKALLRKAGLLERIGTHDYVGDSKLRERLPEVYDRVYAFVALGSNETQPNQTGHEATRPR